MYSLCDVSSVSSVFSTFLKNKFSSQCHILNSPDTVQTDESGAASTKKNEINLRTKCNRLKNYRLHETGFWLQHLEHVKSPGKVQTDPEKSSKIFSWSNSWWHGKNGKIQFLEISQLLEWYLSHNPRIFGKM